MKILPDGTVEITNKRTGATKIVQPADLPNYGISYTKYADEAKAFSSVGGKAQGLDVPLSATEQKKADADKAKQDIITTAQSLQEVIKNKDKYNPDAYKSAVNSIASALTMQKKEADKLGASLTGNELAILSGQVPVVEQKGQNALDKLTGRIPPQTGKVLDSEEVMKNKLALLISGLQGKKISPEQLNQVSPAEDQGKSLQGLLSNAGSNTKDILNSILGLPAQAIDLQKKYGSMGKSVISGEGPGRGVLMNALFPAGQAAQEANQALGQPLQGGDIIGRATNRAYEKPVTTAMDIATLIPFLKGKSAEVPQPTKSFNEVSQGANPVQDMLRQATDVVSGGGSKEYLARTANNPNSLPQNQVLLEEGILAKPTATGKITATSKSMNKYGSQIGDIYKKSTEPIMGADLGKAIDSQLKDMGYDTKSVRFMKGYINDHGGFDLSKGDSSIPQEKAWLAARNLETSPPKMMKNPESVAMYKKLSQDAARIIRDTLAQKNPEVVPLNARYSALADYMNNVLKDPQGISAQGGIINNVAKGAKVGLDALLNVGYNAANPTKLIRDMRYKQGNPKFIQSK